MTRHSIKSFFLWAPTAICAGMGSGCPGCKQNSAMAVTAREGALPCWAEIRGGGGGAMLGAEEGSKSQNGYLKDMREMESPSPPYSLC